MKINATTGKIIVSDEKALALQSLSHSLKRTMGLERHECPNWTEALEETLARLPCASLNHLENLIEVIRAGKATGELPK